MGEDAWEVSHGGPPAGLDVHIERDRDGLTLWIDPPPRSALIREALAPPVVIGVFVVLLGILALQAILLRSLILAAALIFGGWRLFRHMRDFLQNAGVVTRIEVRDGWLTWRKKTLWGESERRWEARSITDVKKANFMLKVSRQHGMPLGAFAYRNAEGLDWVAKVLRAALPSASGERPEIERRA
jgi:hypothetical protein